MLLTANLRRAVIYEPGPGDLPDLDAAADELEALVAGDEREAMLEKFFRELVGFTAEQYAELRASDAFPPQMVLAHTVPREVRAIKHAWPLDADTYAAIDTPTLLLTGSDSPAGDRRMTDLVHATLPNSHIAADGVPEHVERAADRVHHGGHVLVLAFDRVVGSVAALASATSIHQP